MAQFKLLDAEMASDESVRLSLSPQEKLSPHSTEFAVLIGPNGSGKSRLLASIAAAFSALEEFSKAPKKRFYREFPLANLSYLVGDSRVDVRRYISGVEVHVDGRPITIDNTPLPSRVLAVSMNAFDRFPLGSSKGREGSRYRYMGLRDRTGRASSSRLLSELISNIFSNRDLDEYSRRHRVASTLEYLGFDPCISIEYRMRVSRAVLDALVLRTSYENLSGRDQNEFDRITARAKREGADITPAAVYFSETNIGGLISVDVNFVVGDYEISNIELLNTLRELNVLSLSRVDVSHVGGEKFDLRLASSGEQSMISMILGIISAVAPGSLVMIDEPETSLHPQWQSDFIRRALETFSEFLGCQFIIATHSPLIISDLPDGTPVLTLGRNAHSLENDELAGSSSDYLLVEAFDSPGHKNLYVRDELARAFRLAATGQTQADEFIALRERLTSLLPQLPADDPSVSVIRELATVGRRG